MAYIQSIRILNNQPQITIKTAAAHDTIPGDMCWDGKTPNTGAPSAYLRKPGSKFSIQVEVHGIDSTKFGTTCTMFAYHKDDYRTRATTSQNIDWKADSNTILSRCSVAITGPIATFTWSWQPGDTPVGWFGDYTFSLGVQGNPSSFTDIQTLLLELYLLPVSALPDYFQENNQTQVPLMLLRMFILGQGSTNTQQSWVASCVNIVHGSIKPFDASPSDTTKHWLKYEHTHGSAAFTSQYGGTGFAIGSWLDAYRKWSTNPQLTTNVNCYDQAAAVEVALCLGIPHTQINWEFHQVYGFIDASLVGWGPCNNPYFDISKNNCHTAPNDSARQPFRNHAYLSWSSQSLEIDDYQRYNKSMTGIHSHEEYVTNASIFEGKLSDRLLMIDACAGPALGTDTREVYESKIVLVGSSKAPPSDYVQQNITFFTDSEEHYLGPGISFPNANSWQKQLSPIQSAKFPNMRDNILSMLTIGDFTTRIQEADVVKVQSIFVEFVKRHQNWQQVTMVPVRDHMTVDDTNVFETRFSYTTVAPTPGVAQTNIPLTCTASLRISLNSKKDWTGKQWIIPTACAAHLAYTALTSDVDNAIASRGTISLPSGKKPPSIKVPGQKQRRVFIWQNAAVEVYMSSNDAWGDDSEDNSILQSLLAKIVELQKQTQSDGVDTMENANGSEE